MPDATAFYPNQISLETKKEITSPIIISTMVFSRHIKFYFRDFHGQGTGTGMDTMDGMDKNGLLNGQWTMDNGQEWTWRGLASTTYFLSTESTESAENFLGLWL